MGTIDVEQEAARRQCLPEPGRRRAMKIRSKETASLRRRKSKIGRYKSRVTLD